jgi:predicted DCC family thiol-disulfide oxidoreductase YuxK
MVAVDPSDIAAPVERPVILYKGTCPFCRATARLLERMDSHERLGFLPFEDADAQRFLDPIPEIEREASWHMIKPDGTRLSAGDATVELMFHIDRFRWLGRIVRTLHLTWAVGLFYWVVSRLRGQLSRFLPGTPGPRRFP